MKETVLFMMALAVFSLFSEGTKSRKGGNRDADFYVATCLSFIILGAIYGIYGTVNANNEYSCE